MAPNINKVSSNYYIHDDVSFSILSKLPLKSLKRFTSACKSWSQLFENPTFMKIFCKKFMSMHQSLYNDTCLFLNIKDTETHPYYQDGYNLFLLSGDKFENKVKLNCNCNNTIMLHSGINDILCFSDFDDKIVFLWKPATKEMVHVHPSPAQCLSIDNVRFNLHGYGYDHVNDDYKIIRHVRIDEYDLDDYIDWNYLPSTPHSFWEIYSVKTSSWKRLDLVNIPISIGLKVYLNGFCHWFTDGDNTYMVSFNLSNGIVFTTLLPLDMQDSYHDEWMIKSVDPMDRYVDLVVLNEFLVMISKNVKTSCFHIYILGEIGARESWTKIFIIGQLPGVERPIGAGKKGELFFIKNDNQIACFDLNTQTIEDLGIKGFPLCTVFTICKNTRLAE